MTLEWIDPPKEIATLERVTQELHSNPGEWAILLRNAIQPHDGFLAYLTKKNIEWHMIPTGNRLLINLYARAPKENR